MGTRFFSATQPFQTFFKRAASARTDRLSSAAIMLKGFAVVLAWTCHQQTQSLMS